MADNDAQLLKGVLTMVLLQLLAQEENYGYAVVVRLRELGFDGLAEGTVYPALTRLEQRGSLAARLVPSTSGPARKYYRITDQGWDDLARSRRGWDDLALAVGRVMASPGPAIGPQDQRMEHQQPEHQQPEHQQPEHEHPEGRE